MDKKLWTLVPSGRGGTNRENSGGPSTSSGMISGLRDVSMTRWPHVPIVEVIRATGVPLKPRPSDGSVHVGGHPYRHGSKSGECLVVWPEKGNWYCSSCKERGDVVDWLIGAGKIDETVIESMSDTIAYLTKEYGESPYEWQEPVPFPDIVGPPAPVDVLPPRLERFIDEQMKSMVHQFNEIPTLSDMDDMILRRGLEEFMAK